MSSFLDQREQANMQWVQDPNQNIVDNLSNVRRETSRHFREKKKEYLEAKIDEIETKSEIKFSGICTGLSMNLRRVNNLELIQ